uniref:Immunoglobulin domain-containing protein n=1 Tax=Ursus americanus TaxID=9643 RepID=A0A452R0W3_URSAM
LKGPSLSLACFFLLGGMFNKPSLVALPSPIVTSGGSVTLQCGSWQAFDWFVLCSEGGEGHPRHLDAQHQADGWFQALFPVDPMSPSHRPTYRCYGYFSSSPYVWSTSSLILELLISGVSRKPSLSVLPGPTVAPGENVTLRCQSPSLFDAFLLSKEGEAGPPLHLRSQHQDGVFQANFPLRPATLDHGGTYRCYGSLGSTPFLLSHPSDPLELVVTGEGLSEWSWDGASHWAPCSAGSLLHPFPLLLCPLMRSLYLIDRWNIKKKSLMGRNQRGRQTMRDSGLREPN